MKYPHNGNKLTWLIDCLIDIFIWNLSQLLRIQNKCFCDPITNCFSMKMNELFKQKYKIIGNFNLEIFCGVCENKEIFI